MNEIKVCKNETYENSYKILNSDTTMTARNWSATIFACFGLSKSSHCTV